MTTSLTRGHQIDLISRMNMWSTLGRDKYLHPQIGYNRPANGLLRKAVSFYFGHGSAENGGDHTCRRTESTALLYRERMIFQSGSFDCTTNRSSHLTQSMSRSHGGIPVLTFGVGTGIWNEYGGKAGVTFQKRTWNLFFSVTPVMMSGLRAGIWWTEWEATSVLIGRRSSSYSCPFGMWGLGSW